MLGVVYKPFPMFPMSVKVIQHSAQCPATSIVIGVE